MRTQNLAPKKAMSRDYNSRKYGSCLHSVKVSVSSRSQKVVLAMFELQKYKLTLKGHLYCEPPKNLSDFHRKKTFFAEEILIRRPVTTGIISALQFCKRCLLKR